MKKAPKVMKKVPMKGLLSVHGPQQVPKVNYKLLYSLKDSEDKRRQVAYIEKWFRDRGWAPPFEEAGP